MRKYLTILFLCLIPALATAKKSYPPYPEVWGYDYFDEVNDLRFVQVQPRMSTNGDCYLNYDAKNPEDKENSLDTVIRFFAQTKEVLSTNKQKKKYYNYLFKNLRDTSKPYMVLKNKKIIDITTNHDARRDYPNDLYLLEPNRLHFNYAYMINEFTQNKIIDYEVSVIGIALVCEPDTKCENWAYNLASELIYLKDDTFIAYNFDYPLLVRFDKDFKTKFAPKRGIKLDGSRELKSNFLVIPYAKVDYFFRYIAKNYTGIYTSEINQQFLDYLYEQQQKGFFS